MMMLGIACLVFAVVLRLKIRKHLTITTLAHLPNLVAVRYLNMLLIEDIYARHRHLRFVHFALGFLAHATFATYLVLYIIFSL